MVAKNERKVGITGFTKKQRQEALAREKLKYEQKGYTFSRYEDISMASSFAIFTVPVGGEKWHVKYRGWLWAAFFIFVVINWPSSESPQAVVANPTVSVAPLKSSEPIQQPVKAIIQTPYYSLGITANDFRNQFNDFMDENDLEVHLGKLEITEGENVSAFKGKFSNTAYVMGGINKDDGTMREIALMFGGSESMAENLKIFGTSITASNIINPSVSKEENAKIVMAMIKTALENIDNPSAKHEEKRVGNFVYTAIAIKSLGLISFGIQDKKQP